MSLLYKLLFLLSYLLAFPFDSFATTYTDDINENLEILGGKIDLIAQKMDGLQYVQWVQIGLICVLIIVAMWNTLRR